MGFNKNKELEKDFYESLTPYQRMMKEERLMQALTGKNLRGNEVEGDFSDRFERFINS